MDLPGEPWHLDKWVGIIVLMQVQGGGYSQSRCRGATNNLRDSEILNDIPYNSLGVVVLQKIYSGQRCNLRVIEQHVVHYRHA